ncbi:MAG TPA: PAS domain S-box protein [Gemmatimonadales bacterium]|nr:PAS domain S-box protein [Gemmatimonadales bacterium]
MRRALARVGPPDQGLLSAVVEASPTGILLVDRTGRIVMANEQIERIVGYPRADLIGRALDDLLPERSRAVHRGHLVAFRADPHPRQLGASRELCARHRDGHEVPVEIGLAPVTYDGKEYVLASVIDISERRRTEAQLRWLSLAVDQGPTSVIMTDVAGNIVYVNPKFTEVTGYTLDEVRGKNPRLLQSGATPPDVYRDLWATITAGRPWHGEILNRTKAGAPYWDAMWVYPIRGPDGSVTHFLALKEDVTDRHTAEEALRASEVYHRTILENIGDAVFIVDATGHFLDANPRACDLTGYTRDELLARTVADTYPPEQRDVAAERVSLAASGSAVVVERPVVRKDGKVVVVEANAHPLASGRMVVTMRDVTKRRELEQQLRQSQKMEAVGRLAGGVAHDFNNVLTAIFGYADLLLEDLPDVSPQRQDIQEIRKAAERASGLTRQLLAFSRQQVLKPVVLSLHELVEDFEKMVQRLLGEDVKLLLHLAADAGNVRADPGQLQQVIMNLAVNARDAMPTGGDLVIETANAELSEQYAELHQPVVAGPYVMLAVSDTGTGMTPEVKARLFEPFFTTKERGKGTGLGLSTVYGIVKQSGGYVWVYSELGRGTTFKIYLPRVDAPPDRVASPPEAGTLTGTETVLIAEDDAALRPLVKGLLERLGYTVLEAENAAQALSLAEAHSGPIHILVADVVMPGESGRELARRLAESRSDTKVLYVSGYTGDAIVHHGMLEPGLNFLQKPFTPSAFARKVREVLDRS